MYKIINRHPYEINEGNNVDCCDIVADQLSDLPGAEEQTINKIGFGSFAYCITEKEFYCLNSENEWK